MNAGKTANIFTSETAGPDTQDRSQAPAPTPDGTSALSGDLETVISAGAVEEGSVKTGVAANKRRNYRCCPHRSPI